MRNEHEGAFLKYAILGTEQVRKGRTAILGAWCGYSRLMLCGAWHVTCSCRWTEAVHAVARVALHLPGTLNCDCPQSHVCRVSGKFRACAHLCPFIAPFPFPSVSSSARPFLCPTRSLWRLKALRLTHPLITSTTRGRKPWKRLRSRLGPNQMRMQMRSMWQHT